MISRAAFVAAFLLAPGLTHAQAPVACGPEHCHVPVTRLTHQETRPFVLGRSILTEEFGAWDSYRRALRRFPDARNCLVRGQRNRQDVIDLLAVDWPRLRGRPNGEVCYFRIFTTLDDMDLIDAWTWASPPYPRHFSRGPVGPPIPDMRDGLPERAFRLTAGWDADGYHERFPALLNTLTGFRQQRAMAIRFTSPRTALSFPSTSPARVS